MARPKGGRIPNQNRPVQAPGVGRNSKRHDLERRSVPPLHGSSLQQGDVQALEQGQRVQPIKRTQQPARVNPKARGQANPGGVHASGIPSDPISFLQQRIGGTYTGPKPGPVGHSRNDYRAWLPLLEKIAKSPGASGVLVQAYITRLHNMLTGPVVNEHVMIDQNEADNQLELLLNGGR